MENRCTYTHKEVRIHHAVIGHFSKETWAFGFASDKSFIFDSNKAQNFTLFEINNY